MLVSVCVSVPDTRVLLGPFTNIFFSLSALDSSRRFASFPMVFEHLSPVCLAGFQHLQGGHPRRSGGRRRRPGGRGGAGQEEGLRRSAEERHPVREVLLVLLAPLNSVADKAALRNDKDGSDGFRPLRSH